MVEFAFIVLLLTTIIFTTLGYGRFAQYQNRLSNAAREGAAVARLNPYSVNRGCQAGNNVEDRADRQDTGLSGNGRAPGYTVKVAKRSGDGSLTSYKGCGAANPAVTISPGDRIVVTVTRDIDMHSPAAAAVVGNTATITRQVETVVQG